jgi:hypothetical protein
MMDQSVGQAPTRLTSQENEHEDRPLRPSIDQSSNAESKH